MSNAALKLTSINTKVSDEISDLWCGIGGLAKAILAHRAGFEVTIFDQFDTPEPVGSGLVIQPVGLRVLEQLGAAKSALAKGAKGSTK